MGGDADLVARVRRGDRQAFDDLYDRYADDVFSMCLVVLGDPTVARAAAGTAFALVARTRMNPLSDPSRLRSWLLELARGSALAWSGSPQARSVPVPHGVSAEEMIEGAIVPAPASLGAGLARTFDRAASAAAHERAAHEHLAARNVPRPRTTDAATAAAVLAAAGTNTPTASTPTPSTPTASTPAAERDGAGVLALGSAELVKAAAGPADAGTDAPTIGAGSHAAAAHAQDPAEIHAGTDGHAAAESAESVSKAAQPITAHGHGLETAIDDLSEITFDAAANVARAAKTAGRFSRKSAGHGTKSARPGATGEQPAAHVTAGLGADHGGGETGHAAGDQPVGLVKHPRGAGTDGLYSLDVDPPTLDTELPSRPETPSDAALPSNIVPLAPRRPFVPAEQFYADGQGAPLVPIDDLEIRSGRGLPSDWRTRPAIAIAASLVVAVAGITAALNWPTPSANLSAENFPDAAIVAPSLVVGTSASHAASTSPPGIAPALAPPPPPVVIITHNQPRPVVDHHPLPATTPPAPTNGGAPVPPPATTTPPAPVTSPPSASPTASGSPTASPTRSTHSPSPTGNAPTSPAPTRATPTAPASAPTQPVTTASPTPPLSHQPAVVGTIDSGNTAAM